MLHRVTSTAPSAWCAFVHSDVCPACGEIYRLEPRKFWLVGLCLTCQAKLPPRVLWRLQTALTPEWFKRWAWLACALLRTGRVISIGAPRERPAATARRAS